MFKDQKYKLGFGFARNKDIKKAEKIEDFFRPRTLIEINYENKLFGF